MTMQPGELTDLGFELVQERKDGSRQFTLRAHPYLVYWLLTYPDGTAQLTWELALGEYLLTKDLAVSAQDELSLFVFPRTEERGTLSEEWVRQQIGRVATLLGSIELDQGT